jgi:sugar lactone lactonase YvrE
MTETTSHPSFATTVRELALEEFGNIHGVTVDGDGNLWFGHGAEPRLACVEPETGRLVRSYPHIRASAGTAFDGTHLWQIAGDEIVCVEPQTGRVVRTLRTPEGVHCSGMAWVPGALWIGDFDGKRLVKVSLETGEVVKELASDRFVTGIEWIGGALWHGAWQQNGACADAGGEDVGASLRRVEEDTGTVLQEVGFDGRWNVSGTGVDARGRLWCGGGGNGGIRAVRLPRG